jgi:hypothetical protein
MIFADSCLVQKKNDSVEKAWKHFFGTEKKFPGYNKIHADMVTLGYDRDFILDPFNQIKETSSPNGGKPVKTEAGIRVWTSQVAESQRYKVMNKPGSNMVVNKVTMWLGIALVLELLVWGIMKATQ